MWLDVLSLRRKTTDRHHDGMDTPRRRVIRPASCLLLFLIAAAWAPSPVSGVEAPPFLRSPGQSTSGNVPLTWGKSPTDGVDFYEVEQRSDGEVWTTAYSGPDLSVTLRIVVEGWHLFRARACTSRGPTCSGFTRTIKVSVTPQFPDYLGSACDSIPQRVPAQQNVGAIEAEAGVSGGAATYRVPIMVAPGRRGVQPAVALSYSSRGGGVAGVGWSVTAASRIHRCERTAAQDGHLAAVTFSNQDRLCLDGERLILVSGTYGLSGSQYRTEIDQFARITMHGNIDGPTSWFAVEQKSGVVSYYGAYDNVNALERPSGAPASLAWWIRQSEDRQGNSIIYTYGTRQGQFDLLGISYTGTRSTPGDRSVTFEYQSRPDKSTRYLAGVLLRSTQRLAAITSKVQGQVVRRYELEYQLSAATSRSLLTQLTECTSNPCTPRTSLPATRFNYQHTPPAFQQEDLPGGAGENVHIFLGADYEGDGTRDWIRHEFAHPWWGSPTHTELHFSSGRVEDITGQPWSDGFGRTFGGFPSWGNHDFDQDGRADLLGVRNGLFAIRSYAGEKTSNLPLSGTSYVLHVGDFDGNGRSDLLVADHGTATVHLQCTPLSRYTLNFCQQAPFPALASSERVQHLSDYDGNGLPDAFVGWAGFGTGPGLPPKIVFTHLAGGTVSFTVREIEDIGGPSGSFTTGRGWVDVNGDQLLDIYTLFPAVWINTGGSFQRASVTGSFDLPRRLQDNVLMMDYDSDGVTELLIPSQVRVGWCYLDLGPVEPLEYCSTPGHSPDFSSSAAPHQYDRTIYQYDAIEFIDDGTGAFTIQRVVTPVEAKLGSRAEDYFGDGLSDVGFMLKRLYGQTAGSSNPLPLGYYNAGVTYGNKVLRNQSGPPDLLVSADDGLGVRSEWEYHPLSSQGSPKCVSQAQIPFYRANFEMWGDDEHFFFASSMQVVARFAQSNGGGGMNPTCYRYEDAMFNNQGRGFLGFRKIIEEEALPDPNHPRALDPNNLRTTTVFRQKFPLVSTAEDISVALASDPVDALPLRRTTQRWASQCTDGSAGPPAQYCFNYVAEVSAMTHDLAPPRNWVSTTTTTMTYQGTDLAYGNLTSEQKTVADSTTRYRKRTDYVYDYSDAAAWWIDRLQRKTVTSEPAEYLEPPRIRPSDFRENDWKVVTTRYDYYPNSHSSRARLPQAQIVQDGVPGESSRTDYQRYDAYGNLEQSTVTAADLPRSRTVVLTYTPDHYFVATETRPLAHQRRYVADPETGQVVSETAPNDLTTTKTLDDFGRVLEISEPGVPIAHYRVRACAGDCPPHARYKMILQQDGSPIMTSYVDRLGRTVESRHTAFDGAREIIEVTQYDARGRTIRTSQPADRPSGAFFTEYQGFDALGRPIRKIVNKAGYTDRRGQPDESFVTEYFYKGLTTRIVLDGSLTADRTYNAMGRLMSTVDTLGNSTHYRYDAMGRLILIEDSAGNRIRVGYDHLGRRQWMDDPDRGRWSFSFNGAGELLSQNDANRNMVSFAYDDLGRLVERRVNGALDARWFFDTQGKGTLDEERRLDPQTGQPVFTRTFRYDAFFRPTLKRLAFNGRTYDVKQAYNCNGLVHGIQYPNGEAVQFEYTPYGDLRLERNPLAQPGQPSFYREVLRMSPRGQVELERFGNGLYGKHEYFASTGQVQRVCVGTDERCANPRQELEYGYQDPFGNLTHQTKRFQGAMQSVREDFSYDKLHRLDRATRTWTSRLPRPVTVDYGYDALGNITAKDDYATNYQYGQQGRGNAANAGPHAVRSVEKVGQGTVSDFRYDGNGNLMAGDGRQITYTFFNKPETITERGFTTRFFYDPDHDRYRQETSSRVTHYVEGLFEAIDTPTADEQKAYVGSNAIVTRTSSSRDVKWLHGDRLGSIETVTDATGQVVESHGFGPFGTPRGDNWEDSSGKLGSKVTTRGFTTHEHLDQHRLIHMNGRAYDPRLGRFLSVDPFIQDIANGQNLNPYSYILNNPLSGVDPSGYAAGDETVTTTQVRRGFASPGSCTGTHICYAYTVTATTTEVATGRFVVTVANTSNGKITQAFFGGDGVELNPSDIEGPLTKGAREQRNLAEGRLTLARQQQQYDEGKPSWERTDELLQLHGAVMLSPLAALVAIEAANAVLLRALAALGPGAYTTLLNILSGLNDGPQFAPTGSAGRLAGYGDEVAEGIGRARPILSETLENAPKLKSVNLPSWRRVIIDMGHVAERHIVGGQYAGEGGRDVFPKTMNALGVERAIRQAYRYSEKVRVQGDRIMLRGVGAGMRIEMWFNKATKTIETAYPLTADR